MATKAKEQPKLEDKDTLFVGRLVYDVMKFTLSKCGLPETALPKTESKANVYTRPNLIKLAAAPALRSALIMRDKWRPMFISRHKSSGLEENEIFILLGQLQICCPLSRDRTKQSGVEVFLALCNEIILFCHYENLDIDPIRMVKVTASVIILAIGSSRNMPKKVEEVFRPVDDVGKFIRWITNFIEEYAIPYGSREVSDIFTERFKNRFLEVCKETAFPEVPEVQQVKDRLGFLPHEAFSAVKVEGSMTLPEDLLLGSGSTLPGDRKSPEPPRPPASSKSARRQLQDRLGFSPHDALSDSEDEDEESTTLSDFLLGSGSNLPGDRESPEPPELPKSSKRGAVRRGSNKTAQGEQMKTSASNLGIEDDLEQMSFGSKEGKHGGTPHRKKGKKGKKKSHKK